MNGHSSSNDNNNNQFETFYHDDVTAGESVGRRHGHAMTSSSNTAAASISQVDANNEVLSFSPMQIEMQSFDTSNNNNNPKSTSPTTGYKTLDDSSNHNENDSSFSPSHNRVSSLEYDEVNEFAENESILYPVHVVPITTQWKDSFLSWLYPAETPPECQLFRKENIAVPACYLLVGLLQGLSAPLINVLPLDLGASEAQQATVSSIRSIPASFKILFGFWSDTVPINGYRRKPYMLLGWCMASFSLLCLLMFSNLRIPARNAGCFKAENNEDDNNDDNNNENSNDDLEELGAPTIPFLSLCLLGFGIGFWLADVMGDSIVAEKAKLELPEQRGSLQSTCYACRFFGIMVAAPLSTYLYSTVGPYYVVLLLSVMPLTIIPFIYTLYEKQHGYIVPVRDQCYEIWNTVCSRAVWQPMGFVYLYNILQVGNAAWREFLVTALHFTSCQLNLILILAYVLLYLGILSYRYYFITWSWRKVYIATTALGGFFSLLQILLIKGITFGLSPFMFALGDDAFAEFISGIQFLPTTIMMVHLCPEGSEGASYAMFTTVNNSALNLSGAISTQLLKIWDVSRTAFASGEYQGMINLTYLTTFVQVSAIAFIGLLPRYKEDLIELKNSASFYSTSSIGGSIFLFITFSSILYAIMIGLLNIIAPGWMGES